jgi:hypothetical protein
MPERPFYFSGGHTWKITESPNIPAARFLRLEGGEAMQKERKEWMCLKGWLLSPWLAIWGEGVVEGLVFSLIALGMWRVAWE